jgi:hypothetical protein
VRSEKEEQGRDLEDHQHPKECAEKWEVQNRDELPNFKEKRLRSTE